MIVYSLSHYDLDGCVSNIVVENAMEQFCDKVVTVTTTYEGMDFKMLNISAMAEAEGLPFVVVITDLNLDVNVIKKVMNIQLCKKVIYIDHHPRDGRGSLEDLKAEYPNNFFVFSWSDSNCGSALALDFFGKHRPSLFSDAVRELVRLTDIYDMWRTGHKDFPAKAYNLNDLFWDLGFDKFKEAFYNGYRLGNDLKAKIKKINSRRREYLEETKRSYSTAFPFAESKSLLFVHNPQGDFINDMTIAFPNHDLYLIFKYQAKGFNIFSVRSRNSGCSVTKLTAAMEKLIPGASGGGHEQAGGFNVPSDYDMEKFFEFFCETATKISQEMSA